MRKVVALNDLTKKLRETMLWIKYVRSYGPRNCRTRLRGPTSVHIQTIDRCNAACIVCPLSLRHLPASHRPGSCLAVVMVQLNL